MMKSGPASPDMQNDLSPAFRATLERTEDSEEELILGLIFENLIKSVRNYATLWDIHCFASDESFLWRDHSRQRKRVFSLRTL
jgi:hypothetical protein